MAGYNSRDVTEGFLRHKLLDRGVAWRFPPPPSQTDVASPVPQRPEEGAGPDRLPLARLLAALQGASDELEGRYHSELHGQVVALQQQDVSGAATCRSLELVREVLFRDGVNWGRIVALMTLGGALSTEAAQTGQTGQVDRIAAWMEESLETLQGWIQDNGGWEAFVELYESRPPVTNWTPGSVFGLVVLGAAFVTLGLLLAQR
ncbi:apoptosis regulator Bcl-2 isoform X2 [Fundulus heteroclitus]|uniref:apoptosis regulator Bcl-2 isoform X2 n=1 Tax=Fundulus heteroclitus TaxID=8078 RepID=UPI00165C2BA7|nr:apoptosis regulator Bcl-2 isoform X2 [Fundulus heteroclitus]